MITRDIIIEALQRLGGQAWLSQLYPATREICEEVGRSRPKSWNDTVRRQLQSHCESCKYYRDGDPKLFVNPQPGYWALKRGRM